MAKAKRVAKSDSKDVNTEITFEEVTEWLANNEKTEMHPASINGKKLIKKTTLSFHEAMGFVADLVEACVSESDDLYTPEGFDITVRLGVMTKYGNFEMPESADKAYPVIYDDYIYRAILREINWLQMDDLCEAAKKRIEYRLNMNISTASSKINELIAKMDEVMSAGSSVFSDIEQSKANKLMRNLADMESVDEKSIVDALVKEFAPKEKSKTRTARSKSKTTSKSDSNIVVLRKEDGQRTM